MGRSVSAAEKVQTDLDAPITDKRGGIRRLFENHQGSVSRIVSKAGAVRANHYHKTDDHYCYVERGSVVYAWRRVGERHSPRELSFGPGEMFYTGPMVEHAMFFPDDTVLYVFSKRSRSREDYERDLVRLDKPLLTE